MQVMRRFLLYCAVVFGMAACSSNDFSDLDKFMADTKAKPAGLIQPIPVFQPYQAFTYSAQSLRPPFEKPMEIMKVARSGGDNSQIKPDPNRPKE